MEIVKSLTYDFASFSVQKVTKEDIQNFNALNTEEKKAKATELKNVISDLSLLSKNERTQFDNFMDDFTKIQITSETVSKLKNASFAEAKEFMQEYSDKVDEYSYRRLSKEELQSFKQMEYTFLQAIIISDDNAMNKALFETLKAHDEPHRTSWTFDANIGYHDKNTCKINGKEYGPLIVVSGNITEEYASQQHKHHRVDYNHKRLDGIDAKEHLERRIADYKTILKNNVSLDGMGQMSHDYSQKDTLQKDLKFYEDVLKRYNEIKASLQSTNTINRFQEGFEN